MPAIPRLVFAAPGSSSGKTVASLLFSAWARAQGLAPRAFKCGPDFLDPQFLSLASGADTPSLDPWFLDPNKLRTHFSDWASPRLNVIEGVMGLYDGKRGEPFGAFSTASVAKTLAAPVVLVLSARKAGQSLAATALGLMRADPKVNVAGILLNHATPKSIAFHAPHFRRLCGLPILGALPSLPELELPERHLGLTASSELPGLKGRISRALSKATPSAGFGRLLRAAKAAPAIVRRGGPAAHPSRRPGSRFVLAVARDEAFHFYYPENLRALSNAGAELASFSPLRSERLPDGARGLLLGGGFPESFAPALAKNQALHLQVRALLAKGLPVWAECGGLMWLSRELRDLQGLRFPLVGALDADVEMTPGLQDFGYAQVKAAKSGPVLGRGQGFRGHEFHHSRLLPRRGLRTLWGVTQSGRPPRPEGYALPGGLATYVHAYLPAAPQALQNFTKACLKWPGSGA